MSWLVCQRMALGLAVIAGAGLLVLPTYSRTSVSSDGGIETELLTLTQAGRSRRSCSCPSC